MGAPSLVLAVAAQRLGHLPKAGEWLVWVKKALGVVLIGLAVYFLKPAAASVLRAVPHAPARAIGGPGARAPAWQAYSPERLAQALREGRPILVDIYADWCLPCVELDHVTFRHPGVVQALEPFATLRVDATQTVPPDAEELLARYQVFGVPTILVFDVKGRERPDLRINGFVTPQELLERLSRLRAEHDP